MPGFTTHYLFGQQSYQRLRPCGLKQTIQKYHTVFSLGLQGPDIFFYDILSFLSAKSNPGSIAHTADTKEFLQHLLESPKIFLQKKERDIAHAYILGFIGHYLLDTKCHPYVYAMTGYGKRTKGYIGRHICLEADIDTVLLWRCQRRLPSEFHQNETISLSKEQRTVVSAVLHYAFSKTYPGLKVTNRRIAQAIYAMRLSTKLLYDPSGLKKKLIRRIERIFPGYPLLSPLVPSDPPTAYKDPCNQRHRPWSNPWKSALKSTASFYELFETAQEEYVFTLNEIARFLSRKRSAKSEEKAESLLLAALGNLCYHSGLSSDPYPRSREARPTGKYPKTS